MAAGLANVQGIKKEGLYDSLVRATAGLVTGGQGRAEGDGIPFTTNHVGWMFGIFCLRDNHNITKVTNYRQVMDCNSERFNQFFHLMLDQGIYFAPASFEAGFTSIAHSENDIQATLDAAAVAFAALS